MVDMPLLGSSPPIQNGKQKRGGLLTIADKAKLDTLTPANIAGLKLLLDPPRSRAYRSTTQAIAHATITAATFDAVRYNLAGAGAGAVVPWVAGSPTRLTVPAGSAGVYLCTASVQMASTAGGSGDRWCAIRRNGDNNQLFGLATLIYNANFFRAAPAMQFQCAAGDYFELVAYQDSGVSITFGQAGTVYGLELAMQRLSD